MLLGGSIYILTNMCMYVYSNIATKEYMDICKNEPGPSLQGLENVWAKAFPGRKRGGTACIALRRHAYVYTCAR